MGGNVEDYYKSGAHLAPRPEYEKLSREKALEAIREGYCKPNPIKRYYREKGELYSPTQIMLVLQAMRLEGILKWGDHGYVIVGEDE